MECGRSRTFHLAFEHAQSFIELRLKFFHFESAEDKEENKMKMEGAPSMHMEWTQRLHTVVPFDHTKLQTVVTGMVQHTPCVVTYYVAPILHLLIYLLESTL